MRSQAAYRIRAPLPERIHRLIRRGDTQGRYRSRSEALQAILFAAVNAGYSREAARRLLSDPSDEAASYVTHDRQGRPRRNPEGYFDRCWAKAERFAAEHPPFRDRGEVQLLLSEIEAAADAAAWPGRGGATDHAILGALLAIARRSGKLRVSAAVRDLAVMINGSPSTASEALRRLERAGWVRKVASAGPMRARMWEVRNPAEHTDLSGADRRGGVTVPNIQTHHVSTGLWVRDGYASPDLFGWGRGLGWSAGRVYQLLDAEPRSPAGLAAELGVGAPAVRRQLRALEPHGLARRVTDGWVRGPANQADVARRLGTEGSQEARRQDVERHRQRRDAFLRRKR